MRVITQHQVGDPDVLEATQAPDPTPGPGEVLIRVGAIGVNPVDTAVRAGYFPLLGEPPFVLGWDVAGTVAAVGPGVTAHAVGDRVFGMPRFPGAAETYAELVVAPAADLARTPASLDDRHAAALPLVGLTAHQALVTLGGVRAGHRVLVPAAGGGVGHVAVQVAKALGAEVVATASPRKAAFVRGLGADEVVDYTTSPLSAVGTVDVAIDPFGGERLPATLAQVRDGGTLALLMGEVDEESRAAADARGVTAVRIRVAPDPDGLAMLVDLVEQGLLTPHVSAVFDLEKAADAHEHLATGPQGKVVLVP